MQVPAHQFSAATTRKNPTRKHVVIASEREKTLPAASNSPRLFRLYRWAATLAAINLNFSRKENTGMKIKTHVKAGASNGEIVIGAIAK